MCIVKKSYSRPQVATFGTVESLTLIQVMGNSNPIRWTE
jgi:hypothetical protein